MRADFANLLIPLAVAGVYLILVRLADLNEREPMWSIATAFGAGVAAALVTRVLVSSTALVLTTWPGAAAEETAKLAAFLVSLGIFAGVARMQGWFELSDPVDGIIYGITIGLGYSTGGILLRELTPVSIALQTLSPSFGRTLVESALNGLAHGVFGGVTGLGIGLARSRSGTATRILLVAIGLAGAIALNAAFRQLVHGNALGGTTGLVRAWLAVILPGAFLVAIGVVGLILERRAIETELADEVAAGVITAAELDLLRRFWRRQLRYLGLIGRGRMAECLHAAALHNRQVQLAFAKRRLAGRGPGAPSAGEPDALRAAIRRYRTLLGILVVVILGAGFTHFRSVPAQELSAAVVRVIGLAKPDLDKFWREQLGTIYRPPVTVGPYTVTSACKFLRNNAVYCGSAHSIYFDPAFFNGLYDEIGDFAPAVVLAHEWGHLTQALRNLDYFWTIQRELQADCLAGQWAHSAGQRRMLDRSDTTEAFEVMRRGRDRRESPWYDSTAHGRAGQRVDAFQEGLDGQACDGAAFWQRVGVDPNASLDITTPAKGSLLAITTRKKGRFVLKDITIKPSLVGGQVTDAVLAHYEAPDGARVELLRAAFTSTAKVDEFVANYVKVMTDSGFVVTKEGQVKEDAIVLGIWKLFEGASEVILYTNKQVVDVTSGPKDVAWEFAIAKAE